jgi:hypothetical protein
MQIPTSHSCTGILLVGLLVFLASMGHAQKYLPVLEVGFGKTYELTEDTLYVGQLRMSDSSRLVLNGPRGAYFLKADRIEIGQGVVFDGRGARGNNGKAGAHGHTPHTACGDGTAGRAGEAGQPGAAAKSLVIETPQLELSGVLEVNLSGGNGGDGGSGGNGGRGGRSTVHCDSHGGNGGAGGAGGFGGAGGTLSLKVTNLKAEELLTQINLINRGGYAGLGGEPGQGGLRGDGSREVSSRKGVAGQAGAAGKRGSNGPALFQSLVVN